MFPYTAQILFDISVVFLLLNFNALVDVQYSLIVVLIFIFLVTNDFEKFSVFICIHMS